MYLFLDINACLGLLIEPAMFGAELTSISILLQYFTIQVAEFIVKLFDIFRWFFGYNNSLISFPILEAFSGQFVQFLNVTFMPFNFLLSFFFVLE